MNTFWFTSFFCNFLKEAICSFCSKKCVSASITERNGLCAEVVLYCKNCDTVIIENFTSSRMESTNSKQAAFVVNRKAVESTNDIQNTTFGFEAHKSNEECNATNEGASGSMDPDYYEHLESLGSEEWHMRYLILLSDGDAKTWTRHNEVVPYGKF